MVELAIFAGGRWRTLDAATGRVSGWRRRARLVVSRAGGLAALPRASLRRMHHRLRPGAPLPPASEPAKPAALKRKHRNSDSDAPSRTVKKMCTAQTQHPASPAVTKRDACIQTETEAFLPKPTTLTFNDTAHSKPNVENRLEELEIRREPEKRNGTQQKSSPQINSQSIEPKPRGPHSKPRTSDAKANSLKERNNNTEKPSYTIPLPDMKMRIENFKRSKNRKKSRFSVSSSDTEADPPSSGEDSVRFKELVVDEEDVQLIRRYLRRHTLTLGATGVVDPRRLDVDPHYKSLVFYSLNPLVHLERSHDIALMLRRRGRHLQSDVESFARQLGLRSVSSALASGGDSSSAFEAPRKTKSPKKKEPRKKRPRVETEGSDAENKRPRPLPKILVPKRSSVPPGREYSPLEDQAIVAWLSAGAERARAVNGNRVWRDLQPHYRAITGADRSWHSLRNRYLRYILPSLHSLALPKEQAQRLRAAAATGKLKARRLQSRRNSIFSSGPPLGAASRRPRPQLASPEASPQRHSPRKRDRAEPPARSPSPPPSSPPSPSSSSSPPPSPPARSPRYSEVTRRFALRPRSTPSTSSPKPPEPPPAMALRTRRLYNPAAAL